MARRMGQGALLDIAVDRDAGQPLQRQLYDKIGGLILNGRLTSGTLLPSSRALARDLGVSRNTVIAAYEQLAAEGFTEAAIGSGTTVASTLPELAPRTAAVPADRNETPRRRGLSRRGATIAAAMRRPTAPHRPFTPGLPDVSGFPFDVWARLLVRTWRRPKPELLAHGEAAGYLPLRRAIADYLVAVRGVRCTAAQVVIVAGAQQGIDLAARVLLDPDDGVWVEDPGYTGVRTALIGAGARVMPVPIDAEGIDLSAGERLGAAPRLACVTPSHHFPLGVTMSLARRLALLDWAGRHDAWILEDDYNSELRYAGPPLAPLQSLDRSGRVIYVGSFSKVMFPSLRIGYLVAPPDLVEPICQARAALDDHPASAVQPVLADFITEGHFASHVRRMRRRYAARQAAMLAAAGRHLDGLLTLKPTEAGLHLIADLAPGLAARCDDEQAAARAAAAGLTVVPLSTAYWRSPKAQGLLLGFASVAENEMEAVVKRLAEALAEPP